MPKRRFRVTRCAENLSSGEKRAGWAETVGAPSGLNFCKECEHVERKPERPGGIGDDHKETGKTRRRGRSGLEQPRTLSV